MILFKNHFHFDGYSNSPNPILMGNFTKGTGELCQVCDSCGVSVLLTQLRGEAMETQHSSFAELQPTYCLGLWTGRPMNQTSARWPPRHTL